MSRKTPVLVETVRVRDGRAPLWHLHVRRLALSCEALRIPFPRTLHVPSDGEDRVHRLTVSLAGTEVTTRPVGPVGPVRLVSSAVVHEPYPHKLTDRSPFERAQAGARAAGADDAILYTPAGSVAEAGIWCLFWWEPAGLAAPALDLGILPGVSRARITELVGGVAERRVDRAGLQGCSLFVANAVRGIVAVAALDGETVPPDPRTDALTARFWP